MFTATAVVILTVVLCARQN